LFINKHLNEIEIMKNQKRQLKESFFNPVYQLYPLLIFLIIDHIFARGYAWYGAAITAIVLTIHVSIAYKRLFKWYMFYMVLFFAITSLMSLSDVFFKTGIFVPIATEIIFFIALLAMRLFRKQLTMLSDKLVSPFVPMSNNILELYRNIRISTIIVFCYLLLYVAITFINHAYQRIEIGILNYVFAGAWISLIVFSYLKTRFVRFHLTDDRWLPVVTKQGEVVEKVQRLSSLSDRRLYTHPVVRGMLIKEGRILVQKSAEKCIFYECKWDNMIDSHINIGEKDTNCLKRAASKSFGIEVKKSFCLTEYVHTTPYEHQYEIVFLILEYSGEIIPNPKKIAQIKWLSVDEIENELNSGVFDERFVKEYELLKRAGLLGTIEEE
jgi:isopentenyldiphosphate isomerase